MVIQDTEVAGVNSVEDDSIPKTSSQNNEGSEKRKTGSERVVFPPPSTWYKSGIAASRDDMWAYCSGGVIVQVKPSFPSGGESSENPNRSHWPTFNLLGSQVDKYTCISYCQSSWDYLPVPSSPLVSGDEKGIVRVWNVDKKSAVIYHDNHYGGSVIGVDWSPCDHSLIYSIDDKANLSVWNVISNSLRSLNFGKVIPTCLKASYEEKSLVCFGTKGGTIFVVDTTCHSGKIISKVRHGDDVVVSLWKPKGDCELLKGCTSSRNSTLPVFVTNVHSMKTPSLRLWTKMGHDLLSVQSWTKDSKAKPYKIFGSAFWARDPNSGDLVLISSGRHGEVVSFTYTTEPSILYKIHNHNAIFAFVQCGDILWSLSFEPMIVGWNLRNNEVEAVIPTLKGACTVAVSPIDLTRVAIGGTDSIIRVLKFDQGYPNKGDSSSSVPFNTSKLKGKVTAIAWHPHKDNCIGFGTDEGVLGIYELRDDNKYAMLFDKRVNSTIYTVCFGPCVSNMGSDEACRGENKGGEETTDKDKSSKKTLMLYACGGYQVFMIHPSKVSNPLLNVSVLIEKTNPPSTEESDDQHNLRTRFKATEIRWTPDYSLFAVGYSDGTIELFKPPMLKLTCWIKCHVRAIQYLDWRPHDFSPSESSTSEEKAFWLASCSNDGTTRLYNMKAIFEETKEEEPLVVISSEATLQGHGIRVISCAWSHLHKNLIVTVGYDCTAIVWNIEDGSSISRYMGHMQRLVACCFHPTDPFRLITISDEMSKDFSVQIWDYRDHPFRKNPNKLKGCHPPEAIKASLENVQGSNVDNSENIAINTTNEVTLVKNVGEIRINGSNGKATYITSKANKQRPKSTFPSSSTNLINAQSSILDDIQTIINRPNDLEDHLHLGVLMGSEHAKRQIEVERNTHESNGHLNFSGILSSWLGDKQWILKCVRERKVTESMLPIISHFSRQLYCEALQVLAEECISNQDYFKASSYYFLLGDLSNATKVLVDNGLYLEAIALMKCNLGDSEDDQRQIEETALMWAHRCVINGNFELACKIFVSLGRYNQAIEVVEKRGVAYAFETACCLSSKIGDERKLDFYGTKYVLEMVCKNSFSSCYDLCKSYNGLSWLFVFVKILETLHQLYECIQSVESEQKLKDIRPELEKIFAEGLPQAQIETDVAKTVQKLSANILVSVAQNQNDAKTIMAKHLALMLLKQQDDLKTKIRHVVDLGSQWFKKSPQYLFSLSFLLQQIASQVSSDDKKDLEEEIREFSELSTSLFSDWCLNQSSSG